MSEVSKKKFKRMGKVDRGVKGGSGLIIKDPRRSVNDGEGRSGVINGAGTSDSLATGPTGVPLRADVEPGVTGIMEAVNNNEGGAATSTRICLDQSSMVDLTPRGPRRRTQTNSQKQNLSPNDPAKNDFFAVCPLSTDEPPIVTKLAGYSVSVYCEMSGWSFMHPLKFYNINLSTRSWKDLRFSKYFEFKNVVDDGGKVGAGVQDLLDKCIPLREMETMIGCNGSVRIPVYVQVIAKRKVDVFVAPTGRINIIPLVVIGDKSGYCVLCSFSEGLATVYNEVDVGDLLLITSCIPQHPYRTYHQGLFADESFINMELKIQWHSVRSHYKRKFSPMNVSLFQMAPVLFGNGCSLYTPTEVHESFENPRHKLFAQKLPESYYDVVGVISYVGRIERFRFNDERISSAEQLIDGKIQRLPITPFFLFRWVHIVDKTSKPLPMKLYISNLTSAYQDSLVPGTIVIMSHCQTEDVTYSTKYTKSSPFTQIYVGGSIEKYFMLHPQQFKAKTGMLLIRENFSRVVARKDVTWSVGGTQMSKIVDKEKFFEYMSQKQGPPSNIDPSTPLARRESKRIIAKGVIWKVLKVNKKGNRVKVIYVHENNSRSYGFKKTADALCNFLPYECFSHSTWFSFIRELPPFHRSIFKEIRSRDMVKKLQVANRDFCKQLLLPAEFDDPNVLPPAAKLDKVDGSPYFLIDVVNEHANKWYTCIWKSNEYTHLEMIKKINAAKDKTVFCLIDVFCVEPGKPLEVSLHDFVTE